MAQHSKLVSMMILFCVVCPLGSLMRIGMMLYEYYHPQWHDSFFERSRFVSFLMPHKLHYVVNNDPDTNISTGGFTSYFRPILNHNTTVDHIVQSVFHHHKVPIGLSPLNPIRDSKAVLHQDVSIVLPWIFAFTILIIFPLSVIVLHALAHRFDAEKKYKNKKMKILDMCLKEYQKNICADDVKLKRSEQCDDNEDTLREYVLSVPNPGIPKTSSHFDERHVSGTCAICLSSYKENETIVWSSSTNCQHVFHKDCILSWIKTKFASSCPCCRRPYIDKKLYITMKYRYNQSR
mmetsp:Transcript_5188/g.6689  ORF Transcript_5188/g.6689 Transcript_5188/m.6689 type:complete len:292 (-) Transcript_5188:139-1014(-)